MYATQPRVSLLPKAFGLLPAIAIGRTADFFPQHCVDGSEIELSLETLLLMKQTANE